MARVSEMEARISYSSVDDRDILYLIRAVREGIGYMMFLNLANKSPFSLPEWCGFLHLSERTMQRYKKEKKAFDPLQSEKILQIALLNNHGLEVFGNKEKYTAWLESENIALGRIRPKELFDSAFGIDLLKDELSRIEYGVLA